MHLSIPAVASLVLIILILPSYASAQQPLPSKSIYHLHRDDKIYDIQYSITNATLQSITIDDPTATLTVNMITDANRTGQNKAGNITLTIPRQLLDKLANIGSLAIFVDDEDAKYKEVSSNCDHRTISMNFPAGANTIDIVGTFAPSLVWTSNSTYTMPANLDVNVDGKTYQVSSHGFAKLCSWDFIKEEKRLAIHYADGYNLTTISISMPKDLLGAPYMVKVNGQPLDVNNTKVFNQTESESFPKSTRYNDLSIHTDSPVKDVEVIGATVTPEFSPLVILAITVGAIGIVVMTGRMMRFGDWKN